MQSKNIMQDISRNAGLTKPLGEASIKERTTLSETERKHLFSQVDHEVSAQWRTAKQESWFAEFADRTGSEYD